MNNWIGPTVKQVWNYAMHVLHIFLGFNINTTASSLGQYSLHLLLLKSTMPKLARDDKIRPLPSTIIYGHQCSLLHHRESLSSVPKLPCSYKNISPSSKKYIATALFEENICWPNQWRSASFLVRQIFDLKLTPVCFRQQ